MPCRPDGSGRVWPMVPPQSTPRPGAAARRHQGGVAGSTHPRGRRDPAAVPRPRRAQATNSLPGVHRSTVKLIG